MEGQWPRGSKVPLTLDKALTGDIVSVVFLGKTLYSHSASIHLRDKDLAHMQSFPLSIFCFTGS